MVSPGSVFWQGKLRELRRHRITVDYDDLRKGVQGALKSAEGRFMVLHENMEKLSI